VRRGEDEGRPAHKGPYQDDVLQDIAIARRVHEELEESVIQREDVHHLVEDYVRYFADLLGRAHVQPAEVVGIEIDLARNRPRVESGAAIKLARRGSGDVALMTVIHEGHVQVEIGVGNAGLLVDERHRDFHASGNDLKRAKDSLDLQPFSVEANCDVEDLVDSPEESWMAGRQVLQPAFVKSNPDGLHCGRLFTCLFFFIKDPLLLFQVKGIFKSDELHDLVDWAIEVRANRMEREGKD